MKRLFLTAALLCVGTAFAQTGVRYDNAITTVSTKVPPNGNTPVLAIPFSHIKICTSAGCPNLATIYSNSSLTVTTANPLVTDGQGKFGFWAPAGTYFYEVHNQLGNLIGTYPFTLGGSGGTGAGTVTSFSAGTLAPLFTTAVANATSTPALSFTLSAAGADSIFGNFSGSSAVPAFGSLLSCSGASNALTYNTTTHVFGCNTISAGGGGNTTSTSLTNNRLPKANGPTSLVDSSVSDDGTTVSTPEVIAAQSDGVHAGVAEIGGNTTLPTLDANNFHLIGPNSASFTGYGWQAPSATTSGILHVGTPSGNVSQLTISAVDLTADVTGTLPTGNISATVRTRAFGTTFGDTGGSALTSGSVVYFTVPYACTISAWNITVDAGTVTFDIWKIATGTAVPTVTNTITASALPALSTGTAIHSTTLTGWITSVAANDIFGVQLKTVATSKFAEIDLQCNQ